MGKKKEKRYNMHSEWCPDMCSLGLTRDELQDDFEIPLDIMCSVDALKNGESMEYYWNTIERSDR